jgi:phospholipid transport system transporter-binding protein
VTATIRAEGAGRFAIAGTLDHDSVPALWRQIATLLDGAPEAQVDLQQVSRSDSAGLALLVSWLREGHRRGIEVRFHHVPSQLVDIARTSGLDGLLPIEE